jgi:DNA-binding beta-propeller fold protein YncE
MAFMDANTWYLADGYDGTRVIKYDMQGKKLLQWGLQGTPPNEKRPGYFNSVHGIAVDATTRRVYVNDRNNGRVQVFDENGKFLDQWDFGPRPPMNIHSIYMGANRILWAADQGFVGNVRHVPGLHVGGARVRHRQGGQPLHRRSENRPHPEVRAAQGRQP